MRSVDRLPMSADVWVKRGDPHASARVGLRAEPIPIVDERPGSAPAHNLVHPGATCEKGYEEVRGVQPMIWRRM